MNLKKPLPENWLEDGMSDYEESRAELHNNDSAKDSGGTNSEEDYGFLQQDGDDPIGRMTPGGVSFLMY